MPDNTMHKDHRQRMRKRFLEAGADSFADHELLELLLQYGIPRVNVNPLAHTLIEEFGSLAGVLEAAPEDLEKTKGIGASAALLLHLMPAMFQRYQLSKTKGTIYNSTSKLGEMLQKYYADKPQECVTAVLLDNNCRLIRLHQIGKGSACASQISERELLRAVLQYNAASVVLAHNHPRGVCQPSRADITSTARLRELLKHVDVSLVDHIILTEERWISLVANRYI